MCAALFLRRRLPAPRCTIPPPHTGTTGDNTPNSSGTLDLGGFSQTITDLSTAGTGTANRIGNSPLTDGALTINYSGPGRTYGGALGYAANNFTVTKTGSGTLTHTGANTFYRALTISNGTLALSGSGTISGSDHHG